MNFRSLPGSRKTCHFFRLSADLAYARFSLSSPQVPPPQPQPVDPEEDEYDHLLGGIDDNDLLELEVHESQYCSQAVIPLKPGFVHQNSSSRPFNPQPAAPPQPIPQMQTFRHPPSYQPNPHAAAPFSGTRDTPFSYHHRPAAGPIPVDASAKRDTTDMDIDSRAAPAFATTASSPFDPQIAALQAEINKVHIQFCTVFLGVWEASSGKGGARRGRLRQLGGSRGGPHRSD
ncbi:hypothetical protein BDK51DRAFT_48732 [Blyttiomyces helicus]|uniref:Uncharacterized protein n=1 Tax=Blyttiomyces helicus TaxID=388810 RepID=A0A4P9W3W7_9FUNG|nr:hypothetical protein BDK51DRAFT_48732 [Blyttiomyces helicus]|eukprot:RKO86005.1 hypothetical protein BDK51DRAFT_48732 [Blyttiomyces helicus]